MAEVSPLDGTEGLSSPRSRVDATRSYDEWYSLLRGPSGYSAHSSNSVVDFALIPYVRSEGNENGSGINALCHSDKDLQLSFPPSVVVGTK